MSGQPRSMVARRRHRGLINRRSACAAVLIATFIWVGCSVEKHYALLSFFFDGVPDPALIEAARTELERVRLAGGTIYTHEPYAKDQCGACHRDARGAVNMQVPPNVCSNCHEGVGDEYRFIHGPVAAKACVWCHSPHESTRANLLRTSPVELCASCHGTDRRPIPEHSDPQRNCLDCHFGHGGNNRFFIRTTDR